MREVGKITSISLNLQRHRQLLPSRKARGKRDRHRRVLRRAVVGQRDDGTRPGHRSFRHINDNSTTPHEPRRGLGRAAHERGDGRSRRHREDDAAAQRVVDVLQSISCLSTHVIISMRERVFTEQASLF